MVSCLSVYPLKSLEYRDLKRKRSAKLYKKGGGEGEGEG